VSNNQGLENLVNRPPEFEGPVTSMLTFEKNTTDMQEFNYTLPKISDIEGHSFELEVKGL
jgi:hypothetical protein